MTETDINFPGRIFAIGGAGKELVYTMLETEWVLREILRPKFSRSMINVTIVDTTPPQLTAPADITVECIDPAGQSIDVGTAIASEVCCEVAVANDAAATYRLGETVVTWSAVDCENNLTTALQDITVRDTIAPMFDISVNPEILWPPNHKMVEITPSWQADDACCGTAVSVELLTITVNEGDDEDTFDPDFDIDSISIFPNMIFLEISLQASTISS